LGKKLRKGNENEPRYILLDERSSVNRLWSIAVSSPHEKPSQPTIKVMALVNIY